MSPPDVLAFVTRKGGEAKSTSAASVAVSLARRSPNGVLVCDMDPQGNLTEALGAHRLVRAGRTIGHALADNSIPVSECLIEHPKIARLAVLGSAEDYLTKVEPALQTQTGGEKYLRTLLREIPRAFDWVIIDTPPNLGALTSCALVAATRVIIPSEAEPYGVRAAMKVHDLIADMHRHEVNPDLRLDGVLFVKVDPRVLLTQETIDAVRTGTDLPVIPISVPRTIRIAEAVGRAAPITHTHPQLPAAQAYEDLARWLLGDKTLDVTKYGLTGEPSQIKEAA